MSEGIETVVNISGKYYRAIIPHPEDFTLERPILAIWPDELTEAEATRLWEVQHHAAALALTEYPAPERAILQDLIAGVQTAIDDYEPRMHGSARAYLIGIRDRAEARLREVAR